MAIELNSINYNTGYAQFSVDSESDLTMLPKTNTSGKGKLATISSVCQRSFACGTNGVDYILNGSNKWVEYVKNIESNSGIEVLLENEIDLLNVTGITIQDCYKYSAFLVYIREIEATVVVPSFSEKVRTNKISINVNSLNVNSSPISTNQITLQSTKIILYLSDSSKGKAQLYIEGSFPGCKGDKVVIDINGRPTFTPLTTMYLWRVYGILK